MEASDSRRPVVLILLVGLLAAVASPALAQQLRYDVLIRGGQVVDGTGTPAVDADVGIRGDTIAAVGDLGGATARRTIDAEGLVVAPGFIDVHNHTTAAMADPARRFNEAFLRQGVTTVVGGPDGRYGPGMIRSVLDAYEEHGTGTNVAFYVGHNAIRLEVMGTAVDRPLTFENRARARPAGEVQQRPPTAAEMEEMQALVREGMELGAVGFSTGLMYPPGMFSTTNEVVELARVAGRYGGIYDSHVRDPAWEWIESNREAIEIGERAGMPAKLGHLKAVGRHNGANVDSLLTMVEEARERGVAVVADQYPYDAAGGSMSLRDLILITGDRAENYRLLEDRDSVSTLLNDPQQRRRIREQSENGIDGGFSWIETAGYMSLRITRSPDYPGLVGKYLSEIAEERDADPFDVVVGLYLQAEGRVDVKGGIEEATVQRLLRQPWTMVASDGSYADSTNAHPRATGTFPRVLGRYVRELNLLSLEEAIRKMTSFPAEFIGLSDRGRIAEGRPADIAVFDPQAIEDRSTYERPNVFSTGVRHVLVNGVPVLLEAELTGKAPGRYLRRER